MKSRLPEAKYSHLEDSDEKTTREYRLPNQFLKLNLDKIRECIDLLEEHYKDCISKENIVEAKSAHQRILLFKELEKEKMKNEAKKIYANQRQLVEEKMKEELDTYTQEAENEFKNLNQAFEAQELEMLKSHEKELGEYKTIFVEEFNKRRPKPSSECLNWIRIKEVCMKQDNLAKAKEASEKIIQLQKEDIRKFEQEKSKKLSSELKNILRRQENEKNALALKKKSCIDMFEQTRDKNLDHIKKKYETKLKELKNYQEFEMSNFNKITRGITTTCSRIQSIVNSATGIREEETDNDKNNEPNSLKQSEEVQEQPQENEEKFEEENEENERIQEENQKEENDDLGNKEEENEGLKEENENREENEVEQIEDGDYEVNADE